MEVLHEEGLAPKAEYIENASNRKTAKEAIKRLLTLKQRPEVILANNDMLAISAMAEAMKNGVKIPEEMKFVGFDGTDEAEFTYPSLTTFKVSVDDAVEKLLELLFRRIENVKTKPLKISIEPELIQRESI